MTFVIVNYPRMVDAAVASSATLQIDGPASPAVALWRLVGTLTVAQAQVLADEIKLLAGAASPDRPSGEPGARIAEGVRERHSSWCAVRQGGVCGCRPWWEAWVYSRTDRGQDPQGVPGVLGSEGLAPPA